MAAPHTLENPPRAALIGGGFIGPVHAEALRRIGVSAVGLLGSTRERAQEQASRLAIRRVYSNLDELLNDDSVEIVHVASPNAVHFEQVDRVLNSGRHVLCEKPLVTNVAESGQLLRTARARPAQASAVNYNIRYYPICQEMKGRVERGDIGRVIAVSGSYTQDWLLYPTDYNWRVEPDGGTNLRALADIGTHWMDLAQFVVGSKIESVLADLTIVHPSRKRPLGASETFGAKSTVEGVDVPIRTEDMAGVLLRFEHQIRGGFHVSQVSAGRKNRLYLEIAGTEGAMCWDSESPNRLWIGHRNRSNELLERDPALMTPRASRVSNYPGGHAEGFPDTFAQLFLDVYGWILSGSGSAPNFPTFEDGDREIRLCEALARSAREERWIRVDSIEPAAPTD